MSAEAIVPLLMFVAREDTKPPPACETKIANDVDKREPSLWGRARPLLAPVPPHRVSAPPHPGTIPRWPLERERGEAPVDAATSAGEAHHRRGEKAPGARGALPRPPSLPFFEVSLVGSQPPEQVRVKLPSASMQSWPHFMSLRHAHVASGTWQFGGSGMHV